MYGILHLPLPTFLLDDHEWLCPALQIISMLTEAPKMICILKFQKVFTLETRRTHLISINI